MGMLLPNDPPRSAYIHVPFCRHRCGYCNFTLVARRDDLIDPFLAALERELAGIEGRPELDTLYLGGGTPTHLPPANLAQLFAMVQTRFNLAPHAEVTVEANPLDLDDARVAVLRAAGVTRISLGVQSFHDEKLRVLERDHRRADLTLALEQAFRVTDHVSLDLIFAAPGETVAAWQSDLEIAVATGVEHVSTYGLTIEPGTTFYGRSLRGQLIRSPESVEADMYELAIDLLGSAGIEQYEVSNFARPGAHSRHNETYWRGRSYFACGPGAARYVQGVREMNHRSTSVWLARVLHGQSAIAERESLEPEDRARERLVFGLRMLAGVDPTELREETGYDMIALLDDVIAPLVKQRLLEWSHGKLRLTRRGLLVSDAIWPKFLRR